MLNPFFQQGSKTEQSLVQDLINEQLKIYGIECYYMPRKYVTEKTVMREVIESKFDASYPIEAYVQSYEGYDDNSVLLSKFGIQNTNEVTLVISKERYEEYIAPLLAAEENEKLSSRPKEGDLLYFPLGDRLFEIKQVIHDKPFYQLQENYTFELRCELFRYENEVIDTGVSEIDDELQAVEGADGEDLFLGRTQTLSMVGIASTATAVSGTLVNGAIRLIAISNRGGGYVTPPRVGFSSAPSGGVTGIASAIMIGGIEVCNKNVSPGTKSVQSVQMSNAGSGYTQAPAITFASNTGSGAIATAFINSGQVGVVNMTFGGSGYSTAPTVTFSTPKHVGAAATATLEMPVVGGGVSVVAATVSIGASSLYFPGGTTGGVFYKTTPTVTFDLPTGSGNNALATATISNASDPGAISTADINSAGTGYVVNDEVTLEQSHLMPAGQPGAGAILRVTSVTGGGGVTGFTIINGGSNYVVSDPSNSNDYREARGGSGNDNFRIKITDVSGATGGVVSSVGLTTGGRFYTSVPVVTIDHPGTSFASATIGIAGTSIDPGSIAFSTTGRAYTTAPTVAISTSSGQDAPTQVAVGIATIDAVTGIVTAVSFDVSDPWAIGSGATIGAGYTAAPILTFSGSPSPIQATATVTIDIDGVVDSITLGSNGFGYQTVPNVNIAGPGGTDEQFRALGIATMRFNSVKTAGTVGIGSTYITGITTTNIIVGDRVRLQFDHETSHTIFPAVNFISTSTYVSSVGYGTIYMSEAATNVGVATTAFEFGIDQCGIVTGIAVTFGGGGYLVAPGVTITNDPSEKNYVELVAGIHTATGNAIVSAAGTISGIEITDTGANYVLEPTITVAAASTSGGTGTFEFNEIVTGSVTGTTARVRKWDGTTFDLEVSNITGYFATGEVVVGSASSASYEIRVIDQNINNDGFGDNSDIETEADSILDFSEQNPFGIP